MSSKHLRRYLEEHGKLQKEEVQDESSSEKDESDREVRLGNKFTFLEGFADESSHGNDDAKLDVEKDKAPQKVTKKKKRRNKKKSEKKVQDISDDELPFPAAGTEEVTPHSSSENFMFERDIFKVEPRTLDGEMELRKMLGLKQNEARGHHQRGRFGRIVKKKNAWPELRNVGLSMELDHEEGNILWFKFIHHTSYRAFQQAFWLYADAANHAGIGEILSECPYHLDSLMIMAEVMRHQEDYQVARDLIERGIYCCESVFASRFELSNYNHRINYGQFENRAFFLLLHRHMRNLVDRSCFTTALNVAKLIYRLDPIDDPLAITLSIDTLALKAGQYQYLLQLYEILKESRRLDRLPSFAYSLALAYFHLALESNESEMQEKANYHLAHAIYHFPTVLVQLLNKMNIQPDPAVENHSRMNTLAHERESEGFKHLTKVYIALSFDLWKESGVLSWLETATHNAVATFDEHIAEVKQWAEIRKTYVGIPRNVERHGWLWDVTQSAEWTLTDPAPPYISSSTYTPNARQLPAPGSAFWRLVTSLLPEENQAFQFNIVVERAADILRQLFVTRNQPNAAQPPPPDEPPQH